MRVVVIGGGLGGLATAARLAKLGHAVTLLEQGDRLGGALTPWEEAGFTWDRGAHSTLLPAVLRDLFRKSGRPLERELDLVPLDVIRRHRFADGSVLALPGGRAAQLRAVDELGPGLGQRWLDHVASYADTWEALRRHHLEVPTPRDRLPDEARAVLDSRESLHRRLRRDLPRRAAPAGRRPPLRRRGPRPAQRPVVARRPRLPRAAVRRLDRARRPLRGHRRTGAPDGDPGGRRPDRHHRPGRRRPGRPLRRRGDRRRRARRRGGRVRRRPAPAPDPRAPRRGDDAGAAPGAGPPRSRRSGATGCRTSATSWCSTATRSLVVRAGGTAPEGHTAWTVHGRGRIAEDLLAGPGPGRGRRPRPGGRTRRPLGPCPGRGGRVGDGGAVAGPRHRTPPAGPDHAGARGRTPPGRTRGPAAGCRWWGCRPRWWPR